MQGIVVREGYDTPLVECELLLSRHAQAEIRVKTFRVPQRIPRGV